jgi:hypothetical protein
LWFRNYLSPALGNKCDDGVSKYMVTFVQEKLNHAITVSYEFIELTYMIKHTFAATCLTRVGLQRGHHSCLRLANTESPAFKLTIGATLMPINEQCLMKC